LIDDWSVLGAVMVLEKPERGEKGRRIPARYTCLNHQGQQMGFNEGGSKMTQKFRSGDDYTNIFSSLADVRSYQRKHGGRIYVCEFKPGRPAAEQDWRPITVR